MDTDTRNVSLVGMRDQQCWIRWPNECNFVVHPRKQKKCWTCVEDDVWWKSNFVQHLPTSCNIVQHGATWRPNECNMLDSTNLTNVASTTLHSFGNPVQHRWTRACPLSWLCGYLYYLLHALSRECSIYMAKKQFWISQQGNLKYKQSLFK